MLIDPPMTASQENPPIRSPATFRDPKSHLEAIRKDQKAKTDGWWKVAGLSGTLAGVGAALDGIAEIPAHWKSAIKSDIAALCVGAFNWIDLDVHFHVGGPEDSNGNRLRASETLHFHAVASNKLLG